MTKGRLFYAYVTGMCLVLATLLFTACKDSENLEKWYPDTMSYEPFKIENAEGHFMYDDADKEWHFVFDNSNEVLGKSFMCTDNPDVIVKNMDEQFKDVNAKVVVSGNARFLYAKKESVGKQTFQTYYYSLEIASVKTIDDLQAKTRSSESNQLICGTVASNPPIWLMGRSAIQTKKYNKAEFRVFVHIVRSSAGVGFSNSIAKTLLEKLNSYYNVYNISFSLSGTDYIDNDRYNLMTMSEAANHGNGLYAINSHSDAINIYVISDGTKLGSLLGIAEDIPSTSVIINSEEYAKFTVAHEVGHCLGLYHTHHGTGEQGGTPELVNGSNATIAGDYIVDTPADPKIWSAGLYAGGNKTDANEDKYAPDPRNLMSYSFNRYQNIFTSGQVDFIFKTISNYSVLKSVGVFSMMSIDGPDYIEEKASYSIKPAIGCTVNWEVKLKSFTSKNTSNITNLSGGSGNSFTLYNPNVDAVSQQYNIVAIQKNSYGAEFKFLKDAYHLRPSGKTGTLTWASESSGNVSYTGTLDLDKGASYNRIKVYQGGYISFIYKDACGVDSYNDSYFAFNIYDSHFSKGQASHIFQCNSYTNVGTYNCQVVLYVGSVQKVIPITIEVLQNKNPYILKQTDKVVQSLK